MIKKLKESEILEESRLTTEFTMGFELEAIARGRQDESDIYGFFDKFFPGGDLHSDGSLHPDTEYAYDFESGSDEDNEDYVDYGYGSCDTPFEWASPVLPVNVSTFQKIIKMFDSGFKDSFFYVNDSCGFHHHLSFSGITMDDVIWIMSNLSIDESMRKKLSRFQNYNFVSGWSDDDYLDELADAVYNDDYKRVIKKCSTQKYSLVNVHSRGHTLEWRGPRGFLSEENKGIIINFYKVLWSFVKWISDTLDSKEINGVSKENFLQQCRATSEYSNLLTSFPRIKIKNKDGLLTTGQMNKLISDNGLLTKVLASRKQSPRVVDQILQYLFNERKNLGKTVERITELAPEAPSVRRVHNLAYKYIPFVELKNYPQLIDSETIENTSYITLKRFFFGAKSNDSDCEKLFKEHYDGVIDVSAMLKKDAANTSNRKLSSKLISYLGSAKILELIYENIDNPEFTKALIEDVWYKVSYEIDCKLYGMMKAQSPKYDDLLNKYHTYILSNVKNNNIDTLLDSVKTLTPQEIVFLMSLKEFRENNTSQLKNSIVSHNIMSSKEFDQLLNKYYYPNVGYYYRLDTDEELRKSIDDESSKFLRRNRANNG